MDDPVLDPATLRWVADQCIEHAEFYERPNREIESRNAGYNMRNMARRLRLKATRQEKAKKVRATAARVYRSACIDLMPPLRARFQG